MRKLFHVSNNCLVESPEGDLAVECIIAPDEGDRRYCTADLGIDEHNLVSALDPDELSRVEFEPMHAAVIYSVPRNYISEDKFFFKSGSVGAFLFKDRLVIVTAEDITLFDTPQIGRIRSLQGILLKFIGRAVRHFERHLKGIGMMVDELQEKINTAMENRHLLHLFTIEKSLVYYLNFIHSNGLLLERMKSQAARLGLDADALDVLDDLVIENTQCYKQADILSTVIASLMDARASIVGNNLNVLMRRLMLVNIALLSPALVISLFSMNVPLPVGHHAVVFYCILAAAAIAGVVTVLLLNRNQNHKGF